MKRLNEILLERKVDAQYVTLTLMYWNTRNARTDACERRGNTPVDLPWRRAHPYHRPKGCRSGLLEDREYDEVTVQTKKGDAMLSVLRRCCGSVKPRESGVRNGQAIQGAEVCLRRLGDGNRQGCVRRSGPAHRRRAYDGRSDRVSCCESE